MVVDSVDDQSRLQASQLKLFGFRRLELEGLHEAETAQIFGTEVLDRVAEDLTHLRGVTNETVAFDHVQHRQCSGAGQRVAAEGRPMVARFEDVCPGIRKARADGHSAAQSLGQGHDVGRDAGVLVREPPAGATESGLDLVEDQEQVVAVAPLADALQVSGGRGDDADLAHHRFEHHRDRLVGGRGLDRGRVVEGDVDESVRQRLERV